MAKINVLDYYETLLQAQPEKTIKDKNGQPFTIPAKEAGKAKRVLAQYEEVTVEFILPESFTEKIKKGDVLHVRCPDLEKIKPFVIYNVDRIDQSK